MTDSDTAHERIAEMLVCGEKFPNGVDFTGLFIYHGGSVYPVRDEAVGRAGPTTAARTDRYTDADLGMEAIY